ncbi:MAG: hypothetical protein HY807_03135 [Nitrospirae bacterium]|nr:hypothetical protein [Nitrospirota bacterium]
MNTISQITIILILVTAIIFGSEQKSDTEELSHNNLINAIPEKDIDYGCGCAYFLKSEGTPIVFISDMEFENAIMNINGMTVNIIPEHIDDIPNNAKVGDKFLQRYNYKNIKLIFENIIKSVCTPDDEGCEDVKFDSRLTIEDGIKDEVYQVQGHCGC